MCWFCFGFSFQQSTLSFKELKCITGWKNVHQFLIYFKTFVSFMGSHITWMLFALHVPYSKFCKDGQMMSIWLKHVVIEINKIIFFLILPVSAEAAAIARDLYCLRSLDPPRSYVFPLQFSLTLFQGRFTKRRCPSCKQALRTRKHIWRLMIAPLSCNTVQNFLRKTPNSCQESGLCDIILFKFPE